MSDTPPPIPPSLPSEEPQQTLESRFPDMKPMGRTPGLFSYNGIGMGMRGQRDFDAETGTYVKSHCITFIFIPIFVLGAYRVADAENGGWYFLGKVGKSRFGKIVNSLAIAAAVTIGVGAVWSARANSPEYQAKQMLGFATEHVEAEEYLDAAQVYLSIIDDDLPKADEAMTGLQSSLKQALKSDSAEETAAAVELIANLDDRHSIDTRSVFPNLVPTIQGRADQFSGDQPEGALAILDAASDLVPPPDNLDTQREALLRRITQTSPDKMGPAVDLANLLENSDRGEEAFEFLQPHAANLGTGEGSRILGQILLARGEATEAVPLLENYIKPRHKKWRNAEKAYSSAADNAYQRYLDYLNEDKAPRSFYTKYENAGSDTAKAALVDEFIYNKMEKDRRYVSAGEDYERASKVVPVIMDLGISQLQAAQAASDPAIRTALLEKSEEQFLSLKDSSGDSADFKFFLGQVYYWSGRQDEGRKLFDEILEGADRSYQTLTTLSSTLREIGNENEARALVEEAFEKAGTDDEKNGAIFQRANLSTGLDDRIAWLEKVTGGDLYHVAQLASAKADKATSDGSEAEALKQLRIAEDGWAKLPVTAASLNNGALVQFDLFAATGKIAYYEAGSRMMERAVSMESDDSILLGNAADSLITTGLMQVAEGKLHPRIIQDGVSYGSLRYLYTDEKSRSVLAAELSANENFKRGRTLLERALVLAPNSVSLYGRARSMYNFTRDMEAYEGLLTQCEAARFETAAAAAEHQAYLKGQDDEVMRENQTRTLRHEEALLAAIDDASQKQHFKVELALTRASLFSIGDSHDHAKEIAVVKAAYQANPCVRYHSALVELLAKKACSDLAAEVPAFAKLLESCRRYAGPKDTLVLALSSDSLRPHVLASASAKEALNEQLVQAGRFPTWLSADDVVITASLAPDQLTDVRRRFEANRLNPLSARLSQVLSPWLSGHVVTRYLDAVARGDQAKAKAILDKAKAEGKPCPEI